MERLRYAIGLVILGLAGVGAWVLYAALQDVDPARLFHVHVLMRNARGLQSGADVRYRGVLVGSVRRVDLTEDGKKAIATLVLREGKERLVRTNSKFWIVTPRFTGLAGGASGLETLVRDAYVAFITPDPPGPVLTSGSSILGLEQPHVSDQDAVLEPVKRGDLVMTLVAGENHGLAVGSGVLFRGVRTGDVRRIELAPSGRWVEITLRIDRRYRSTVTDRSRFWIARPRITGALLRGNIALEDVGALLSPFVGYATPKEGGLPVPDGHRAVAESERPPTEEADFEPPSDEPSGAERDTVEPGSGPVLVAVHYEAVEEDLTSPDDHVQRVGSGIVFEDQEGNLLVVTARSLVDGAYFMDDVLGTEPEISSESIRIVAGDGTTLRALRTWADPEGQDLAVLTAEVDEIASRRALAHTPAGVMSFADQAPPSASWTLRFVDERGRPVARAETGLPPRLGRLRGAAVVVKDKVVGILGQTDADDESPRLVPLGRLPATLRPPR